MSNKDGYTFVRNEKNKLLLGIQRANRSQTVMPSCSCSSRSGCRVTFNPEIFLDGNKCYQQHRCWEDIFDAISYSKYLIYYSEAFMKSEYNLLCYIDSKTKYNRVICIQIRSHPLSFLKQH